MRGEMLAAERRRSYRSWALQENRTGRHACGKACESGGRRDGIA